MKALLTERDVLRDVCGRLAGGENLLVESCDEAYLEHWARRLGVLELLEECRP